MTKLKSPDPTYQLRSHLHRREGVEKINFKFHLKIRIMFPLCHTDGVEEDLCVRSNHNPSIAFHSKITFPLNERILQAYFTHCIDIFIFSSSFLLTVGGGGEMLEMSLGLPVERITSSSTRKLRKDFSYIISSEATNQKINVSTSDMIFFPPIKCESG